MAACYVDEADSVARCDPVRYAYCDDSAMPDDVDSRLLEALKRLRDLDRTMHRHPIGSKERIELERQVVAARHRVEMLAAKIGEREQAG